jgi:hypothetical protein
MKFAVFKLSVKLLNRWIFWKWDVKEFNIGEWSTLTTQKTNLVTLEDQITNAYLVGVDYAF